MIKFRMSEIEMKKKIIKKMVISFFGMKLKYVVIWIFLVVLITVIIWLYKLKGKYCHWTFYFYDGLKFKSTQQYITLQKEKEGFSNYD